MALEQVAQLAQQDFRLWIFGAVVLLVGLYKVCFFSDPVSLITNPSVVNINRHSLHQRDPRDSWSSSHRRPPPNTRRRPRLRLREMVAQIQQVHLPDPSRQYSCRRSEFL